MSGRRRRRRDPAPRRVEAARRNANPLRGRRLSAILRDMKAPEISYVSVLRVAHPEAPSLREVARQIGVSAASLSLFELGRYELPPAKLKAYAEAIDRPEVEVRWRWARQALAYHALMAIELRKRIEGMRRPGGSSGARPRAPFKRATRPAIDRLKARA